MLADVKFIELSATFNPNFETDEDYLDIYFDAEYNSIEYYEGEYEVTPLTTTQILPTKAKTMEDDVTVFMIPTKEILNAQGGVTFIVG